MDKRMYSSGITSSEPNANISDYFHDESTISTINSPSFENQLREERERQDDVRCEPYGKESRGHKNNPDITKQSSVTFSRRNPTSTPRHDRNRGERNADRAGVGADRNVDKSGGERGADRPIGERNVDRAGTITPKLTLHLNLTFPPRKVDDSNKSAFDKNVDAIFGRETHMIHDCVCTPDSNGELNCHCVELNRNAGQNTSYTRPENAAPNTTYTRAPLPANTSNFSASVPYSSPGPDSSNYPPSANTSHGANASRYPTSSVSSPNTSNYPSSSPHSSPAPNSSYEPSSSPYSSPGPSASQQPRPSPYPGPCPTSSQHPRPNPYSSSGPSAGHHQPASIYSSPGPSASQHPNASMYSSPGPSASQYPSATVYSSPGPSVSQAGHQYSRAPQVMQYSPPNPAANFYPVQSVSAPGTVGTPLACDSSRCIPPCPKHNALYQGSEFYKAIENCETAAPPRKTEVIYSPARNYQTNVPTTPDDFCVNPDPSFLHRWHNIDETYALDDYTASYNPEYSNIRTNPARLTCQDTSLGFSDVSYASNNYPQQSPNTTYGTRSARFTLNRSRTPETEYSLPSPTTENFYDSPEVECVRYQNEIQPPHTTFQVPIDDMDDRSYIHVYGDSP